MFATECQKRGAVTAFPDGDFSPYDLIVDSDGDLYRVQVKSGVMSGGTWRIPAVRHIGGDRKCRGYLTSEIDALVSWLAGKWFIFPWTDRFPDQIYMGSTTDDFAGSKYSWAMNNWPALKLPIMPLGRFHIGWREDS